MRDLQDNVRYSKCSAIQCPYGCEELLCCFNLILHQCTCPMRCCICPCCAKLIRSASDFTRHFSNIVPQPESAPFLINLNKETTIIIESQGELYICSFYYRPKFECLWVSVKYVGLFSHAKRRFFKLRLKFANNEEYRSGRQVQPARSWKVEAYSAMEIPFKASSENEQVQVQINVYCRDSVFPETIKSSLFKDMCCRNCNVFMNRPIIQSYSGYSVCEDCNTGKLGENAIRNIKLESVSEKLLKMEAHKEFDSKVLLKEVECPICFVYLCEPIRTCVSGHSICSNCRLKLKMCPFCRQQFSACKNLSLEEVVSRMHYKCMNAVNGCTVTASPDCIAMHENSCHYRFSNKK